MKTKYVLAEDLLCDYITAKNCFEKKRIINKAKRSLSSSDFIIFLDQCIEFTQISYIKN
jgi:hypothetical protein